MRGFITVPMAAIAAAMICAPPAVADDEQYLWAVKDRYVFLSEQQLLDEGWKVCSVTGSGTLAPDAVNMVIRDLSLSINAANDLVTAAVVRLC